MTTPLSSISNFIGAVPNAMSTAWTGSAATIAERPFAIGAAACSAALGGCTGTQMGVGIGAFLGLSAAAYLGARFRAAAKRDYSIRRAYLDAFSIAMGVDKRRLAVPILLSAKEGYKRCVRNKGALENPDRDTVELIGRTFLGDSHPRLDLSYPVGARVLSLLFEKPTSGCFTNLGGWIGIWRTSNDAQDKFKKALAERLPS